MSALSYDLDPSVGEAMYGWACDLFPIHRSLTGPGVRQTLAYLQALAPELEIQEVASGAPEAIPRISRPGDSVWR